MNLILSRKGFDSSTQGGGNPNIIYNDNFYPIPIPEEGSGIYYKDLKFNKQKSYLEVMVDLNITQFSECHLDPFIGFETTKMKTKGWYPCLGQASLSNNSLINNNVGEGDVFLFFAWFEFAEIVDSRFKWAKKKEYPTGIHSIYAYMQVESRFDLDKRDDPKLPPNHPHLKFHNDRYQEPNSIYKAKNKLSFAPSINGYGRFKFNENLILTEPKKTRSNWLLDKRLKPSIDNSITYLKPSRWNVNRNGMYEVNTQFRGQEIIFKDISDDLKSWVSDLIKKIYKNHGK